MKSVIKTGKTIDEAIQAGLNELGATKEQAEIEILEEPSKGLFGILGGKDAVVRISVEDHFKEELLRDLRLPYVDEKTAKKQEKHIDNTPVEKAEPVVSTESEIQPVQKEESIEEPVEAPVNPVENIDATDALMQEQQEDVLAQEQHENSIEETLEEEPVNPVENIPPTYDLMEEQQEETLLEDHHQKESEEAHDDVHVEDVDVEDEPSVLLLKEMIAPIDANAKYTAQLRNHNLHITVEGQDEDSIGLLIGRRGDTLDAMQYLLSVAAHRKNLPYRKVILDINGYRKKREETLIRLAQRSAQKVKKSGRSFRLEPMNPYERRIIHSELQKMDGVHTISEGNEPYRRVVIRANRNE